MRNNFVYLVNNNTLIYVRRIVINKKHNIIFTDKETDGLKLSYYITDNYSKKNIEKHLSSIFEIYKLIKKI